MKYTSNCAMYLQYIAIYYVVITVSLLILCKTNNKIPFYSLSLVASLLYLQVVFGGMLCVKSPVLFFKFKSNLGEFAPSIAALTAQLSQPRQIKQSSTSTSLNLFEVSLNFYHFFLDSDVLEELGWRKADKCQRLIAKLWTEQQGSGEMKQRKWRSVVETLSYSDSYHSGHHEVMPGCLIQVSEPKEHLSVTSVISVCEGSAAAAARPCQS